MNNQGVRYQQACWAFPVDVIAFENGAGVIRAGKPKREVSIREAEGLLGLCRQTIYGLIEEGKLDARKKTHRRTSPYVVTVESINRFKAACSNAGAA